MAFFSLSITHTALFFLLALFLILFTNPILILSSTPTTIHNPNFSDSQISLFGDAAFVDRDSSIRLTNPSISSSSGLVLLSKGLKFDSVGVFFSAEFAFSISPENGDGFMFVIAPKGFVSRFPGEGRFGVDGLDRFFGVEFDPSMNGNHVGIDVNNLVSSSLVNVSSIGLVLNSGRKLQSWIDYDTGSKRIEVRLSEFGSARPYDPLLSYNVNLGQMWKDEEVFAGISASSGNSTQSSSLYSCKFIVRDVPGSLHSQLLDPNSIKADQSMKTDDEGYKYEQTSRFCPLSILAGLIFTTGCGALLAFVVLFLWVVFVDRHRIQAEPDFKYENINVVVENDIDEARKLQE